MRLKDIFQGTTIVESYTAANTRLLRYLKKPEFDPYTYWNEIRIWFDEHRKYIKVMSKAAGKKYKNADEIEEDEPDIFYKLPAELQKEIEEWVIGWLEQHAPHEAPTYTHVSLKQPQLIPRTTWLVHFTDDPHSIAAKGFTIGVHDMTKLGLTTHFNIDSFEKSMGGYNFAVPAGSREAKNFAYDHKYGKHAVMFQSSGVATYHYGDEENQIVFHGKDVDPRGIIVLWDYSGEEWVVESHHIIRPRGYGREARALFKGDFENCVAWVEKHFDQYRRYLTRY